MSGCAALAACSGGGATTDTTGGAGGTPAAFDPATCIKPDADAQKNALIALFNAHEGDVISFCEGKFDFTTGLVLTGKRGITLIGAGRDKTFLRFANSNDQDGVSINRVTGITIQDLTIYDAPGNGLRIFRSEFVTIHGVKVGWSVSDPDSPYGNYAAPDATGAAPASWTSNGSYAFYPVLCHKVLIEDSISVGSSDAGVYVGQSSDILVQRTEAYHNVAGFEFENTYRAEFVNNIAHDNVGGFLVFDLPGRAQFGEKNLVHDNHSFSNNVKSFAPRGAIVGDVPEGTGMLVLASDQLEVYKNLVEGNNTVGLAIVNYGLVDTKEGDRKYDYYPEGMHVYSNTFNDNGGNPQVPDNSRNGCKGSPLLPEGGVPSTSDLNQPDCASNNANLLVTIIQAKNGGKSAQIVWDGGVDPGPDAYCTQYPVDRFGVLLSQNDPKDAERYEARSDERLKPGFYIYDPPPVCAPPQGQSSDGLHHTYNAWKWFSDGTRKPGQGMCIETNTFTKSPANQANDYVNVHFSTADPTDPKNQVPADNTIPQDCPTLSGTPLLQTVPNLGKFVPNRANDPAPTDAEIAAACGKSLAAGEINYAALLKYNCPLLSQYGLFASATDPTQNPNGFGVPFDLNTILFSDYAVKSRFLFLPPDPAHAGMPQKATYEDRSNCDTIQIFDCNTATLGFPTGTVFAKTFAFRTGTTDNVVETRLLIKRPGVGDAVNWVGMAYQWDDACPETSGTRCARLKIEGATKAVDYDYDDPDPAVVNGSGQRQHYGPGHVDAYGIPNAGNCLLCHGGDDREPGAAPIGPKVRNMNKLHDFGGTIGVVNQLDLLVSKGMLDLPAGKTSATVEKMPKWNVPGSADADPAKDEHMRVRSFLEVNCMHCHNPAGYAQNSGLSLDAADVFANPMALMGEGHGICKPPTAAGKAANNAFYDIQPANSGQSLLALRLASTQAGIKMPPLARTVPEAEAVSLVNDWVDNVVNTYADPNANTCSQTGGTLPADMGPPIR